MRREKRRGGATDAALLLGRDHLGWIAEARTGLLLHLDEPQRAAAARDEVDLVRARPHVRTDDAPAAQPVPACGPALRRIHREGIACDAFIRTRGFPARPSA